MNVETETQNKEVMERQPRFLKILYREMKTD